LVVSGKKEVAGSGMPATSGWLESPYLGRVAARVARQHGLREDDLPELLQDLRIAVWQAGPRAPATAAWIFAVASHKAVDMVRLKTRAHRIGQDLAAMSSQGGRDLELNHLLRARVDSLPARLRQFYDLHYAQGLSERETARSLGVCRASVRWMDRCCRRLVAGPDVIRRSRGQV
jgi:DNA-directed RNA polymerase specialized sigma24 family protein